MLITETNSTNFLTCLCGQRTTLTVNDSQNCYLGLFTVMPGINGEGGVEPPIANGYRRKDIKSVMQMNYKSYAESEIEPTLHARRIGNDASINFPESVNDTDPDLPTGGDWGLIVGYGLFSSDTISGGSYVTTVPFAWGELNTPVKVETQKILLFREGHFEFYMDGDEPKYDIEIGTLTGCTGVRISNDRIKLTISEGYKVTEGQTPSLIKSSDAGQTGGAGCTIVLEDGTGGTTDYCSPSLGEYIFRVNNQTDNLVITGVNNVEAE